MTKSFNSIFMIATLACLLLLLPSIHAQDPQQPPTSAIPRPTATSPSATTGAPAPRPSSNYTGPAPGEFDTLRNVIATFVSQRSANPGHSPTNGADGKSAAAVLPPNSILTGLALVLATVIAAAVGTIGL